MSEEGDYLDISYTCTQNGEVVDETGDSDAAMQLGQYEYFDEDGEKQLLGTKAGDTRTIVVDGGEEEDPQSYTYEVTVKRVYTYDIPELTDDYAREQGCYDVTLNVWEGNDNARAFYEKMGMFVKETQMETIL